MTILPLSYLPSVAWCARLLRGDCTVDLGEHFVKRSERTRARILASDGPMELSVPVCGAGRPRTPLRDVRIDYSKRWQHRHWQALVSAYRSSPYFEHYAARFEPFYRREYRFLADYDLGLLDVLLDALGLPRPAFAERYVEAAPGDLDLRARHCEGRRVQTEGPDDFSPEPYVQVFADRMPFAANLSVADLLFAEGPTASRCGPSRSVTVSER